MSTYVYDFTRGGRDLAGLLGDKGAALAELTRLGLPVPPGFTVTTEAGRAFLATGEPPAGLDEQIGEHLAALERATGKRLGKVDDPLLLAVRTGAGPAAPEVPALRGLPAPRGLPGLMDTILDIGVNDYAVLGLGRTADRERFAWDSYRRLVQMYGTTVLGADPRRFEEVLSGIERQHHVPDAGRLDACDLIRTVETFKDVILESTGEEFPQDPAEQLRRAVHAAFASWNGEPARRHRRRAGLPGGLGAAVTVQAMVFGNLGPDSGSGVARTPVLSAGGATGRVHGRYLAEAQGTDVVAGAREAVPVEELAVLDPPSFARLRDHLRTLAEHCHPRRCDVQFTVEHGALWLLGARVVEPGE
ncbi:PEP/pyruvate-binding domain-containing protein [Streptomyces sp. NPDC051310]|uniref:PEP/pyruvate-binding domain-containing protein n=1 Tax=Streptomyces sp. NPDC051310 TaxID=3365649 RepID=UPI0037B5723A